MQRTRTDNIITETKDAARENTGGIDGCAYKPPGGYIATYGCGGVPYGGIRCCKKTKK